MEEQARRILRATAWLMTALFAATAWPQFLALVRLQPDCPRTLLQGSDGFGYYAWLRSPLIDGDLQFADEFLESQKRWHYTAPLPPPTANGLTMNFWSIGPACLWAGPVAVVHAITASTGLFPANGYSPPYQVAVSLSSFLFGLLGLRLMNLIAREFAEPVPAAIAASIMTVGTMAAYYFSVETSFAHGSATTVFAAFLLLWLRNRNQHSFVRWLFVGVALGFACCFRWQLATFAVIPAFDALAGVFQNRSTIRQLLKRGIAGAAGFAIGFAPQMIGWLLLTGAPFADPHRADKHWLDPDFTQVLFTVHRGFFTWTPAAFVACVSLFAFAIHRSECRAIAAGVLLQVYLVASVIGSSVFLGGAFGFRILSETVVALLPGLALALNEGRLRKPLAIFGIALIVGNILLMGVYRFCIDNFLGGSVGEFVLACAHYLSKRPLDAAMMLMLTARLASLILQSIASTIHANSVLSWPRRLLNRRHCSS